MQAWRVHRLGDPTDVLQLDEVDPPEPGPGEVRVHVAAAGLNFPDALLCQGKYQERPPLPFTPGLEAAGVVSAVGPGVSVPVGLRVAAMASPPNGALAGSCLAPATGVFALPDSLADAAGAALIVTYQTGWFALHNRARLQAGETLLVHAGAGGVGSAAIQLGLAAGARVIATAGGPEKVEVCRRLGADLSIDYLAEDFVEVVKQATDGRGADVIYDPVGGDVFDRSRKCIAWDGRILVIGFTSGRIADAPTNHILLKNYSVVGVHWGASRRRDPDVAQHAHAELMALHEQGRISPLVSAVAPFAEVPAAIAALTARGTWGKLVVRPPV